MSVKTILKQLNLNNKEAELYLNCLELGSASVYKISKKAEIPRSTCYETLEDLQVKGFVTTYNKKNIKYYSAEDPKKILEQQKDKIGLLEKALPQLNAMYGDANIKPTVKFYQGVSGLKIVLDEVLSEAEKIYAVSSAESFFNILGDSWLKFLENRLKKKIPIKIIMTDSVATRAQRPIEAQRLRETRVIPEAYQHNGLILIWKNKFCMFSFKKELLALIVESEELTKTQKTIFDFMWNTLGKD